MSSALNAFLKRLTGIQALLGAIGVVAMLVHISAYVISRHMLSAPIPATVEIVSYYYMLLIAFLPLAWAEQRGEMISVEVFAQLFRGAFKKAVAVFVALVTAGAYVALTYTTWIVAMRHFNSKSFTISLSVAVYTWPGYFILPLSFGLAALVSLLRVYLIITDADPASDHTPVREEEISE